MLSSTFQVVIPEAAEDATEISEREFMGFEKGLLGRVRKRIVEGCAAGHASHREHLKPCSAAPQIGIGFVPDGMSPALRLHRRQYQVKIAE